MTSKTTFIHAVNLIRFELTSIVDTAIEYHDSSLNEFSWLDRITPVDPDTVEFEEDVIQSDDDEDDVKSTRLDVIDRELKTFKTLQTSLARSKLFINPNDSMPHPPMLALMDSMLAVRFSEFSSRSAARYIVWNTPLQKLASMRSDMLDLDDSDALLPAKSLAASKTPGPKSRKVVLNLFYLGYILPFLSSPKTSTRSKPVIVDDDTHSDSNDGTGPGEAGSHATKASTSKTSTLVQKRSLPHPASSTSRAVTAGLTGFALLQKEISPSSSDGEPSHPPPSGIVPRDRFAPSAPPSGSVPPERNSQGVSVHRPLIPIQSFVDDGASFL